MRAAFRAALALYVAAFAGGLAWAVVTQGRPPSLRDSALTLADRAYARGDVQKAAREYRMAARIDASNYDTPKRLAEMLGRAGDPSGEIDQFRRATELWPNDPATHRRLGWAYLHNRRLDEARGAFERSLALLPGDVPTRQALGETLIEAERYEDAARVLAAAAAEESGNAGLRNSLGVALMLAGRGAEAIAAFEQATRLDPRFAPNLERARREAQP